MIPHTQTCPKRQRIRITEDEKETQMTHSCCLTGMPADFSVIPVAIEEPEDVDEQVDKVKVQRDDCQDPLIWAKLLCDEPGVKDDVAREDENAETRHGYIDGLAER